MTEYKSLFSNQLITSQTGIPEYRFDQIDSTNLEAETFLKQLQPSDAGILNTGVVFTATTQAYGQGQFGRTWISEKGGLYYTLLKPYPNYIPSKSTEVVIAIGQVIANAIGILTQLPVQHVHPNDLYIGDKKLGGILIKSTHWQGQTIAIIGIGINVNQAQFPQEIRLLATSCYLQTGITFDTTDFTTTLTTALIDFLAAQ
jgi:BirA family biotin operon repressor/biotin-[acetyl-CoA-carboxylase] ligase